MRLRRIILKAITAYLVFSVLLGIVLGELPFHPARRRVSNLTAISGAAVQDLSITSSDGVPLKAWFVRPDQANGKAVILLHGVGDDREGVVGIAELLLSNGYAVLMPDSRGHGESGGIPTYGIKEVRDVHDWYDWIVRTDGPQCVYGIGLSMGAAILLQSVRVVPFCAVVAESPFASFRQVAYIRVGQIFRAGKWVGQVALRPSIELAFLYARLRYGVWLPDAAPEDAVLGSRVPVLLIHGLADSNIPWEQSQRIYARNPGHMTFWQVPGCEHCGAMGMAGQEYASRVLGWLEGHRLSSHRQ